MEESSRESISCGNPGPAAAALLQLALFEHQNFGDCIWKTRSVQSAPGRSIHPLTRRQELSPEEYPYTGPPQLDPNLLCTKSFLKIPAS